MAVVQKKTTTYHELLNRVHHQRLRFFDRLGAILAAILSILLTITFKSHWVLLPINGLTIWCGFLLFRFIKDQVMEVQASRARNQLERVILNIYSWKFVLLLAAFTANIFILGVFVYFHLGSLLNLSSETPIKTIKPFLNTDFMFYWFHLLISSIAYSSSYVISERYIIQYSEISYRKDPVQYLKKLPYVTIIIKSSLRALFISLLIPLLFWISKDTIFYTMMYPLVLLFGLNSQPSRESYSIVVLVLLTFMTILVYIILDLLSYLYNAYATIGCLVVDKPISSYSETPFQTLITGLKDLNHPLARLTAFQELLYMATTPSIKVREVLYRADNWPVILDILGFVISNAAKSSRSDLPRTKRPINDEINKRIANQVSIFGNLGAYKNTFDDNIFGKGINESETIKEAEGDITVIKKTNASDLFQRKVIDEENRNQNQKKMKAFAIKSVESIENELSKLMGRVNIKLKNFVNDESTSSQIKMISSLISNTFNYLFYGDVQFQARKRLSNKYLVELSVESLTEIMIHSKGEERNNIVFDSLTESLILLAKVYKGTSQFMTIYPDGKDATDISELNQLTMKNFYKLVVFYNSVLNDLILPPEVFKLAKWCTDLAVEMERGEMEWE